jgi:hypothetical protein
VPGRDPLEGVDWKIGRTRECFYRVLGGIHFEIFPVKISLFWIAMYNNAGLSNIHH